MPSDPTPSTPAHEHTAILQRIEAGIADLKALLTRAEHQHAASSAPFAVHTGAEVATDADLDGQYGDPIVRKDPSRWQGQSYVGATYSQCPPEYLDMLAGLLDWQAGKSDEKNETLNNGKPRSLYLRKDAARARGHAARIRARSQRGTPRKPNVPSQDDLDSGIPF